MVTTRLEEKLARIRKDPQGARDFLICDAKDGDMGGGIPMPGPRRDAQGRPTGAFKTRRDYLDQVTALVRQDILDMVLLSVANLERLVGEGVFRDSRVGTAIRANDTTDIWGARGGRLQEPPLAAAPLGADRARDVRPPGHLARHAARADRPRPVLDHLHERRRDRPGGRQQLPRVPDRGRTLGLQALPRGVQPQCRRRQAEPGRDRRVRQRQHRARDRGGAAGVAGRSS